MIHPVFKLAIAQPALLAEHAAAYVSLFGEELALGGRDLLRRLLCWLGALFFVTVAAILAGVAILLWAMPLTAGQPSGWVFVAVPAVPFVLAMWLAWSGRSKGVAANAFATLGQQLSADADVLRNASAP